MYDPDQGKILFSKRVKFHEDNFSGDNEDLKYSEDLVS
jgi:hypothetical protein